MDSRLTPQALEDLKKILDEKILIVESINRNIKYIREILDKHEPTEVQILETRIPFCKR